MKPGDPAPEGKFVDQNGKPRDFSSFKGHPVVDDVHLHPVSDADVLPAHGSQLRGDSEGDQDRAAAAERQLVSVSFDPATDTPPVLKKHAKELDADPRDWTFLTGDRDAIDQFAARFGVSVARALDDQRDITHNLRTAIVGADGRLVKVYTGNEWTPDQVLRDLKGSGGGD